MKRIQKSKGDVYTMKNINAEQLKGFGKIGLKIGKAIVVEGTKALVLKGAAVAITSSFEEGIDGLKDITLDDVIKGKKHKIKDAVFEEKMEG